MRLILITFFCLYFFSVNFIQLSCQGKFPKKICGFDLFKSHSSRRHEERAEREESRQQEEQEQRQISPESSPNVFPPPLQGEPAQEHPLPQVRPEAPIFAHSERELRPRKLEKGESSQPKKE